MYSIVAHPNTLASIPKYQVLLAKILKNGVDDKLRRKTHERGMLALFDWLGIEVSLLECQF
jgi:hypothetical protein